MVVEIDGGTHEHLVRTLFKEQLETVLFEGRVARLGGFGYVHSQGGASAAGDDEDSHAVIGAALLFHYFLELLYCAVGKTYHYNFLLCCLRAPCETR